MRRKGAGEMDQGQCEGLMSWLRSWDLILEIAGGQLERSRWKAEISVLEGSLWLQSKE